MSTITMLYRSILVAIILLLSWFAFISIQSSQQLSFQLSQIKASVDDKAKISAADQLKISEKIDEIEIFITSQRQLSKAKQKVAAELSKQKKLTRLHSTYSKVLNAELLRLDKQYPKAVTLLKSTKKEIWKAGDTYPDKQKILRSLMTKIDALVNAWKKGDGAATAKPVYLVLDEIIQEKGK